MSTLCKNVRLFRIEAHRHKPWPTSQAKIVHHRSRRALNLATEVKIPTLVHGIVDLIGQGPRPLPNFQILKILCKIHAVTFYFLPATFYQRFSGREPGARSKEIESTGAFQGAAKGEEHFALLLQVFQ